MGRGSRRTQWTRGTSGPWASGWSRRASAIRNSQNGRSPVAGSVVSHGTFRAALHGETGGAIRAPGDAPHAFTRASGRFGTWSLLADAGRRLGRAGASPGRSVARPDRRGPALSAAGRGRGAHSSRWSTVGASFAAIPRCCPRHGLRRSTVSTCSKSLLQAGAIEPRARLSPQRWMHHRDPGGPGVALLPELRYQELVELLLVRLAAPPRRAGIPGRPRETIVHQATSTEKATTSAYAPTRTAR